MWPGNARCSCLEKKKPNRGSAAWIQKIAVEDSRPWIQTMDRKQVSGHAPRSLETMASNPVTRNHSICQEQAAYRKILALIDGFIMGLT
jgi:hypothetical protein